MNRPTKRDCTEKNSGVCNACMRMRSPWTRYFGSEPIIRETKRDETNLRNNTLNGVDAIGSGFQMCDIPATPKTIDIHEIVFPVSEFGGISQNSLRIFAHIPHRMMANAVMGDCVF